MSANNQLNQTTPQAVTLNGGKIGGFNQGNGATQLELGALSLTSNSIIDLTSTSLLHFADSSGNSWTGTLSIYNWTGIANLGNATEQSSSD